MFVSLTEVPWFRNILVSHYPNRKQAIDSYVGTGTFLTKYKGKYVVDGGASNNTPFFEDNLRAQICISPGSAELPSKLSHIMKYDLKYATFAFKKGQDDISDFLTGSKTIKAIKYRPK